jgi:hypothetical protein
MKQKRGVDTSDTRSITKAVPVWADIDAEPVRRVSRLVDLRIVADPPAERSRERLMAATAAPGEGRGGYSRDMEREAKIWELWAEEFNAVIREHRIRDPLHLSVERIHEKQCSGCGYAWEAKAGFCASCGCPVTRDEEG